MTTLPEFDGPRLIRPEERSASRRLSRICFSDLPDDEQPEEDFSLPGESGEDETYLFAHQGKPVAQISIFYSRLLVYGSVLRIGSIGGVCTHPDFRGYRLASRLMHHCTQKLVQGGAGLMLISGGRGLYTRLGNVPSGKYACFTLRAGEHPVPENIRLRPVQPGDAALCSRLYQAEAVRFPRRVSVFAEAFHPHPIGFHAEEWVVEMDGQPAAYLMLSVPWDSMDQPEAGERTINEFAGSRVALAGAAAAAVNQPGIRELRVPVPWQDADLIALLRQTGDRSEWVPLQDHTMRIINFPVLMRGLQPYMRAALPPALLRGLRFEQSGPLLVGDGEGQCAIVRGRDRLELTTAAMTNLVMGDPRGMLGDLRFPGALAEILPALFPLPSFHPGLDYH